MLERYFKMDHSHFLSSHSDCTISYWKYVSFVAEAVLLNSGTAVPVYAMKACGKLEV